MTKAKTQAAEAETPTGEDPAIIPAPTEGQDAAGADIQPVTDPEGTPPTGETPAAETADQTPPTAEETLAAAQAKADAEAEAAAAAEAARLAAEAEASAAPELNLAALTHLARTIDMLNTTGHRLGLKDELTDLYGAQIIETDGEGVTVEIEGIKTEPSDSLETALANWANAARRAMAQVAG